jgi:hypothetical protein
VKTTIKKIFLFVSLCSLNGTPQLHIQILWKKNSAPKKISYTMHNFPVYYDSIINIKEKHSVLTSRENTNTKANYQLRRSCQWSSTAIFSISGSLSKYTLFPVL